MTLAKDALRSNLYFRRAMIWKKNFEDSRTNLSKTIAFSKKICFTKILDKTKLHVKRTWQMLHSALTATTNKLSAKIIKEQNKPKTVVNPLNNFFCTIGKKLADKLLDNENHTF